MVLIIIWLCPVVPLLTHPQSRWHTLLSSLGVLSLSLLPLQAVGSPAIQSLTTRQSPDNIVKIDSPTSYWCVRAWFDSYVQELIPLPSNTV